MPNPYQQLPPRAFWRTAVGSRPMDQIADLWSPSFPIGREDSIVTLGSCFAQHISRALVSKGYRWLNSEPAPPLFPEERKPDYHYDVFSARVGNIYTVTLLKQWTYWAFDLAAPPSETWKIGDRFYDPFRPTIEPHGFATELELTELRGQTLSALRGMFESCDVFIFTLGLTEAWVNRRSGVVYPMCPGVIAGEFSDEIHEFRNYDYTEVRSDLEDVIALIRTRNPGMKVVLTVSPVPLTATASDDHVLVATTYSKSTLRAVAGDVARSMEGVDYFPSFEIISSYPFKAAFYEPNLRSVTRDGVAFVMSRFFDKVGGAGEEEAGEANSAQAIAEANGDDYVDVVCEDIILEEMRR